MTTAAARSSLRAAWRRLSMAERLSGTPADDKRGMRDMGKTATRIGVALALLAGLFCGAGPALADTPAATLLRPAAVFDGVDPAAHPGWQVLVVGDRIAAVGPNLAAPAAATIVDLPGDTLMPGMIEGHGHLFLHPFFVTRWPDQVPPDPLALRTARAVRSASGSC